VSPRDPEKPSRNADQDLPKRQGDKIIDTTTEESIPGRDRNAPVPEEETYEREPRNQRPRSMMS
jgi:hypothetical protein